MGYSRHPDLHSVCSYLASILLSVTDDPKRPTGSSALTSFVEDNGHIPTLLGALITGRICDEYLSVSCAAAQHNEVAAGSEVSLCHDGDHELSIS